jgi:hypothetical protein
MASNSKALRHKEEAFAAILERIMAGESLKQICESEGTPARSTVHLWMANDKTLSDRYARACEVRADHVFDEIFDIADTPQLGETVTIKEDGKIETRMEDMLGHRRLQVDARKWALARMQPKKYGDRITHDGTGPAGEIIFKTVYQPKPE